MKHLLPLSLAFFGLSAFTYGEDAPTSPVAPEAPVAPAAAAVEEKKCCKDCFCNFLSDLKGEDYYTDVSMSYLKANHFHGWGVTARMGRWLNRDETQALEGKGSGVELEVNFFKEDHDRIATQYVYDTSIPLSAPLDDTSSVYQDKCVQDRKVDIYMIPIMLNWRYHGSMAGWTDWTFMEKMRWYAGAGLGFSFNHSKDVATNRHYDATGAFVGFDSYRKTHINFSPAGQIFGGIGYACTERCEIFGGLRGFATDGRAFSSGTMTSMKCPKLHIVCDAGLHWQW
jgi:hypothetical protein